MRTEVRAAYFPSSKRHLLAAVGIFLRIFPESESEGDPLISLKLSGNSYMGQDVPRTEALWNKLACPREPTGSLSEAIYSPHTQRLTAGPASRASGWPPNRGPKSLAQPERPAANPAGACDARRLRGGLLGTRR